MREKQPNALYFKCIRYDKTYLGEYNCHENRKMKTKMRFCQSLAHYLTYPISSIGGLAQW